MNARETRSLFDSLPSSVRLYRVLDGVKSGEYDSTMVPGEPLKIDVMGAFAAKSKSMRELMTEIEDAITHRMKRIGLKQKITTVDKARHECAKDKAPIDDILKQNEISRKDLRTAFGIDQNDRIDTRELDGMLNGCVDENENSQELVLAVRNKRDIFDDGMRQNATGGDAE